MSTLINPLTRRSFLLPDLLEAFRSFSRDPALIKILLAKGVQPMTLLQMAARCQAAIDGKVPATERQVCGWLLAFLGDREDRKQVAKHMARVYGVRERVAMKDLYLMAKDCRRALESRVTQVAASAVVQ